MESGIQRDEVASKGQEKVGTIYLITCLVTGKYYVGQTVWPLAVRWSNHKTVAKKGKLKGHLQSAINKYGPENFVIEVLTEAPQDHLNNLEQLWIWALGSQKHGMNLTGGGDGAGTLSDKQRSAISNRMKGNQHGAGKTWTQSQREKCGKKTPEQAEAARLLMLGNTFRKGLPSWCKGKPLPPAQVEKMLANYWEKRTNAAEIKAMLQQQAGNRKGKHKPTPTTRCCSVCMTEREWGKDSRCKECNRVRTMLYRAMMKDAGFKWYEF